MKNTPENTPKFADYDTVIFTKGNHLPLSKNENFGIFFSEAMEHLATNPNLNRLDIRLMNLLLSHMTKKEHQKGQNKIELMTGNEYAEVLQNRKQNISKSLKNLENEGYIHRDKKRRTIIIISPKLAYSEKFKNYQKTHNLHSGEFGYPRIEEKKTQEGDQDWSSSTDFKLLNN